MSAQLIDLAAERRKRQPVCWWLFWLKFWGWA